MLVLGSSLEKGTNTLAADGALPGVAEMTVWLRVHCLLSFAQCGPLNWSLRGQFYTKQDGFFVKPMKFTCSWDRCETRTTTFTNCTAGEF